MCPHNGYCLLKKLTYMYVHVHVHISIVLREGAPCDSMKGFDWSGKHVDGMYIYI